MKYEIGFTMTGSVTVDDENEEEALDKVHLFRMNELSRFVTSIVYNYIVNKETKEKTNF